MSPPTIQSYRDTFVLLRRFLPATQPLDAPTVEVAPLAPPTISAYLTSLEEARHHQVPPRPVRVAASPAFFRDVAPRPPEGLAQAQRMLGMPCNRTASQPIDSCEAEELPILLACRDRATAAGRRDDALLAPMFNTGARGQEMVDVQGRALQLSRP
jgi:site-specific recombinase XerD